MPKRLGAKVFASGGNARANTPKSTLSGWTSLKSIPKNIGSQMRSSAIFKGKKHVGYKNAWNGPRDIPKNPGAGIKGLKNGLTVKKSTPGTWTTGDPLPNMGSGIPRGTSALTYSKVRGTYGR